MINVQIVKCVDNTLFMNGHNLRNGEMYLTRKNRHGNSILLFTENEEWVVIDTNDKISKYRYLNIKNMKGIEFIEEFGVLNYKELQKLHFTKESFRQIARISRGIWYRTATWDMGYSFIYRYINNILS